MNRKLPLIVLLLPAALAAEPLPSASDILESVRLRQVEQQIDLEGQLRQDQTIVPFHLIQSGPSVRYVFSNPDETLQLQLGEKDSRLEVVSAEGTTRVGPAQFDHKVRGTDVSYEDLSFKFLYWPDAQVVGSDNIRGPACWKLELRAPSHETQYSRIVLWVQKAGGALMRMDGYDWKNQLAKRFEAVSVQKIDNRWFLKQMRIEQFQPGTNHVAARTYLEIQK